MSKELAQLLRHVAQENVADLFNDIEVMRDIAHYVLDEHHTLPDIREHLADLATIADDV